MGFAGFFRKYVRDFSIIAGPLFKLTVKDACFVWSHDAQRSFDSLRQALCDAPVIALPQFGPESGEFTLRCDASGEGLGAVLFQTQGGVDRVISYASHRLSKSQRSYSTTKLELLACVTFVDHFRHFLLGKKFRLVTDHASFQWLVNFRNPSGMLARWLERLSEYDFHLMHRPGSENTVADALSRRPADRADAGTQTEPPLSDSCKHVSTDSWSDSFIRCEQGKDPALAEIIECVSAGKRPRRRDLSPAAQVLLRQWDRFRLVNGVLYRCYRRRPGDDALQLVIPDGLIAGVLTSLHAGPTGGHFGAEKLTEQVRLRFWWPRVESCVREFCRMCDRCVSRSTPNPKPRAEMGELRSDEPFDTIAIDFLSGLPVTGRGNKHLLVVTDHFTRWVECFPVPDMKASTVADVLVNEFIARFGCPRRIHSDCAANFQSEIISEMCRILGIEKSKILPYHPEGNSKCERMMRTVLDMLSKYLDDNHNEWDLHLPLLMMGYRSQVHSSLGYSPYFLMFAREPRLPVDVNCVPPQVCRNRSVAEYVDRLCKSLREAHRFALQVSDSRHRRNKRFYDQKLNDFSFGPGDQVFLFRSAVPRGQYYKFVRPWKRAVIVAKLGELNYRVRLDGSRKNMIVHHNRLKPAPLEPSDARLLIPRDSTADAGGSSVPPNGAKVGAGGVSAVGGDPAPCGGLCQTFGRFRVRDAVSFPRSEYTVIDIEGPGEVAGCAGPISKSDYTAIDIEGPEATGCATAGSPAWPVASSVGTVASPVGPVAFPAGSPASPAGPPASPAGLAVSPLRSASSPAGPPESPAGLAVSPLGSASSPVGPAASPVVPTSPRRSGRTRGPPDKYVPRW